MTSHEYDERPRRLVMARSRGTLTGVLLMGLGIWGAIVPFIGHSFNYGYSPNDTWDWTAARGWLEVLPGAATFVGGALITVSAHRVTAMAGAWLAAASGAWFVLGTVVSPWWSAGSIGLPSGSTNVVVWERIGMFDGLGVLIVFLAAVALGRISVIGVRDIKVQSRSDGDRDSGTVRVVHERPVEDVPDGPVAAESAPESATDGANAPRTVDVSDQTAEPAGDTAVDSSRVHGSVI